MPTFNFSDAPQATQDQVLSEQDQNTPSSPFTQAPPRPSMRGPMVAALLGQLGDNISTQMITMKGGHEQNPLLPSNTVGNMAMQGLGSLGTILAVKALGKNHPTLAKILGYGMGGIGAFDTASNINTLHGGKPFIGF